MDFSKIFMHSAGSCSILFKNFFHILFFWIGKIILNTLYSVYSAYLVLQSYAKPVYIKLFWARTKINGVDDETELRIEALLLKKIPQHLTVILGEECPSYKDFVNIIKWSIGTGISHISFYDHHNGIDREALFQCVSANAKQHIPLIKWGKSFSEDIKQRAKDQINGYSWRPVITVHVYHLQDFPIAVLSSIGYFKERGCDGISVNLVDSLFRKNFLAPDPELAVVVGDFLSVYGFPCWHLRITQLQTIASLHNISIHSFVNILRDYSGCEQRYGK